MRQQLLRALCVLLLALFVPLMTVSCGSSSSSTNTTSTITIKGSGGS